MTHASAPAHVVVLEKPWTNRAAPRATALSASAKAKLATASRSSPLTTALLGPSFDAAIPPGMPPRSAPAPNDPTSRPAPVFERSNSSAYPGTSGVNAVKSIASTKITEETRASRRGTSPRIRTPPANARRLRAPCADRRDL